MLWNATEIRKNLFRSVLQHSIQKTEKRVLLVRGQLLQTAVELVFRGFFPRPVKKGLQGDPHGVAHQGKALHRLSLIHI